MEGMECLLDIVEFGLFLDMRAAGGCAVFCAEYSNSVPQRRRSGKAATEVNLESWVPSSHVRAAGIMVERSVERRIQRGCRNM